MKIGNFNISKKLIIVVVAIVLLIIISSLVSKHKEQEEIKRQQAEVEAANQGGDVTEEPTTEFDADKALQEELVKQYGEPPEGFEWDVLGNLVAVGNTGNETAEQVVYIYIRALSILDFSTAQRYSTSSSVVDTYNNYYNEVSEVLTDYYSSFLRKKYKLALTSIELLGVDDVAVFADGTEMVTMRVNILDLTDKDFWKENQEELFTELRKFDEFESDPIKRDQKIYELVYDVYASEDAPKRETTIEIVVSKENGMGWLVKNDKELDSALSYDLGTEITTYIESEYETWLLNKQLEEMEDQIKKETQGDDDSVSSESTKHKEATEGDASSEE